MCSTQVPTESTTPASAGPRVSDEELAQDTMAMRLFPRPTMHIGTLPDAPEYSNTFVKVLDMACDLADARTALATANARIAVLEARDVLVQALSVPLGKLVNTHGRVQTLWDASLESGELDEGDFDTAMNDLNLAVDEMYEGCYETVHARRPERLATASPEPGAAHPDSTTNGDPTLPPHCLTVCARTARTASPNAARNLRRWPCLCRS